MSTSDVRSPGGWLNLYSSRVARWLLVGTLAAGGGAFAVYGQDQGQGAAHFVEVELSAVATADSLITTVASPLQAGMSGSVVADFDSVFCFEETPAPASTLDVGLGDADGEGDPDALVDGLVPRANNCFTLFGSGATKLPARKVVMPSNYTGSASHVTFTWKTGTGQTVSGNPAGFARVKVIPCTVGDVSCD